MPLIHLIFILIVIGVLLWLVNTFIPMQSTIKRIINGIVILFVILWLLSVFGILPELTSIRIGHEGRYR